MVAFVLLFGIGVPLILFLLFLLIAKFMARSFGFVFLVIWRTLGFISDIITGILCLIVSFLTDVTVFVCRCIQKAVSREKTREKFYFSHFKNGCETTLMSLKSGLEGIKDAAVEPFVKVSIPE